MTSRLSFRLLPPGDGDRFEPGAADGMVGRKAYVAVKIHGVPIADVPGGRVVAAEVVADGAFVWVTVESDE